MSGSENEVTRAGARSLRPHDRLDIRSSEEVDKSHVIFYFLRDK